MTRTLLRPVPNEPMIVAESAATADTSRSPYHEWWCNAVHRPQTVDARAEVFPPKSTEPLLVVTLPADTIDAAREVGSFACSLAFYLVRILNRQRPDQAVRDLHALVPPPGQKELWSAEAREELLRQVVDDARTGPWYFPASSAPAES